MSEDMSTEMMSDRACAIYDKILKSISEDGVLSENFSLEDDNDKSSIRFAPGAIDGMIFYHFAGNGNGEAATRELLTSMVTSASEGRFEEAFEIAHEYAEKGHALNDIDFLQKHIIDNGEGLTHGDILRLAVSLTTKGTKTEAVKLGLSLIEIYEISEQNELLDVIRTISLCEEFTLFGGFVLSRLQNGNEELFKLLPRVHGWGMVHLVRMIEANTPEIKEWLLLNGVDNEVLGAYSALECFEKIDYVQSLNDKNLDVEHYRGLSKILCAMTDEGPIEGLSCLDNVEEVIESFARVTMSRRDLEFEDYRTLIELADFLERVEEAGKAVAVNGKEIKKKIDNFLSSDSVWGPGIAALKAGKGFDLAEKLGIPYFEQALKAIQVEPVSNAFLASKLLSSGYKTDEIVGLYYDALQLEKICIGAEDSTGLGDMYPVYQAVLFVIQGLKERTEKGEDFIFEALASPVINNRNAAITTLEGWIEAEGRPLSELSPRLHGRVSELLPCEVRSEIKERLEKLLSLCAEPKDQIN